MEYKKDTSEQVENDIQALRNLKTEYSREKRVEETKMRMQNIYSIVSELNPEKSRSRTIQLGNLQIELSPQPPYNGSMRVYIFEGTGLQKIKKYEFNISINNQTQEYEIDYRQDELNWRKGENPNTSTIYAEEAEHLIPELPEIEKILEEARINIASTGNNQEKAA